MCIESTCPIGTAEAVSRRLPAGVSVASCPERVLPGRILEELVQNDRVVGGVGPDATARAVAFYRSFVRGEVVGTDSRLHRRCDRDPPRRPGRDPPVVGRIPPHLAQLAVGAGVHPWAYGREEAVLRVSDVVHP